jgi:hypothetical protein
MSVSIMMAYTVLGAAGLSVGSAPPAQAAPADYQPNSRDVMGIGSPNALQYILDFGADGDTNGDVGYNSAVNQYKLVSLDGTADSNGRFAYMNNSTSLEGLLEPTVVFRSGSYPWQRPWTNRIGIDDMLANTSSSSTNPSINFVRMGLPPKPIDGTQAQTNGWEGLQIFALGQDHLKIAAATTTNAPVGLSAQQLVSIYECSVTTWE